MKEFRIMSLEEAEELARKWIKKLEKCCCNRVDVVAGVYRGKDPTKDVDLLCQPRDLKLLRDLNPVKEDQIRIVFNDDGRKVEVWKATPEDYELKRWYRRKSRRDYITLASKAKERGMKLSWTKGLLDANGNSITADPKEIEEILASTQ